ncbi:thioredoxin family protein [Parasulfuritortus cantonensis]|uniref:thioredoxin family protein n=1 Tax=Parasulfuritortus cantonensis TaxID=2528202 RepID=UPI001F0E16C6|nr:thioredoxin family protein [Parasulfuritortus cantonensis]
MRWILLFLALLSLPAAAEVRDPNENFFQPKLGDLKDDLAAARSEGKQGILLMFEMDDCPFCDRMKHTVLNQSQVQDYYRKHFIIYPMDTKGDAALVDFKGKNTTEKDFALEQRARATPTFIFYDLDGNAMARFTGATQTVDEFLLLGRYVVEGTYKSVPFNVYKRQAAAK